MSRTAFHGGGQPHPVEISVIVQQAGPGTTHDFQFQVETKIGALRVALVDLHREDIVPCHKKGRRDGRQFNLKIAVVHRTLGKVVVGWVGINIVDADPGPIEKDHDPVIAENPTGAAHNRIRVLDHEGAAKVGGRMLVLGITTETNLTFLVTVAISQFSRTTIPLRVVVAGFPPLTAKVRTRVVESPFRSIRHHRFRTPPRYTHFKDCVLRDHITVIPGDRRIRTRIYYQGYHRQPGLQRSIAGAVTEAVCPEKVVIGRINEGSIRIQGERSVLHILSLNRTQIPTFRITIVIEHSLARKVHGERCVFGNGISLRNRNRPIVNGLHLYDHSSRFRGAAGVRDFIGKTVRSEKIDHGRVNEHAIGSHTHHAMLRREHHHCGGVPSHRVVLQDPSSTANPLRHGDVVEIGADLLIVPGRAVGVGTQGESVIASL